MQSILKLHLEKGSEGEINLEELLNLGNSIREYLKIFKEPFDDGRGGRFLNGKMMRVCVLE
ncbi:hypothetical protein [Campylobacter helveticus]|uniref:hypothetical protein n=1 Tax=Campylobacter helveticus TaxID=28898 RepID=UPI000E166121|nr:hypothetical protein [Campylobacter helveticus]SUW87775.1 Uncharacterised protein [Campylobacter helveticus]